MAYVTMACIDATASPGENECIWKRRVMLAKESISNYYRREQDGEEN